MSVSTPVATDPRTRDDLLAAMKHPACPLCVLVERAERKAVATLLYEQVGDRRSRDVLRASRGACVRHTAMLAEGRSALGVAIVSRDVLRTLTAELEALGGEVPSLGWLKERLGVGGGAQLAARIEPQAGCPLCAAREQIEGPLVAGLLHNLADPAFADSFSRSAGLCRLHLVRALRAADADGARALAARQAAIWRQLEAELDEFIRKHDYRFRAEAFEAERDSWRRALQQISGWYERPVHQAPPAEDSV